MKPPVFEYHRPDSLEEALGMLAGLGDEAKPLAGGQSLVPLMNFRLVRPAHLVDLNRVAELSYVRRDNGDLRIGAMTRQRELERSPLVAEGWPLLKEATRLIGHVPTRNRGTVGGSLAHADSAAELPAVMSVLDAELVARSRQGERALTPDVFFVTYLTTALRPDELLVEVRVPTLPPRTGCTFQEISRRFGDFALVGVAALVTLDDAGAITQARVAFTGMGPTPARATSAEATLVGQRPDEQTFREAAILATRDLDPTSDIHASAAYRREVAGVLARQALLEAATRARSQN